MSGKMLHRYICLRRVPISPNSSQPQYLSSSVATTTDTESLIIKPNPKTTSFRVTQSNSSESVDLPWHLRLRTQNLIFHEKAACTAISRNIYVLLVLLSQSRQEYCFSGPAGLRLGLGGYSKLSRSIASSPHMITTARDYRTVNHRFYSGHSSVSDHDRVGVRPRKLGGPLMVTHYEPSRVAQLHSSAC